MHANRSHPGLVGWVAKCKCGWEAVRPVDNRDHARLVYRQHRHWVLRSVAAQVRKRRVQRAATG